MIRIVVVTLFPEMLRAVTEYGITGRAVKNGLLEVIAINPRDYATDTHRSVDDRPYGGGPGMVMMVGPLRDAILAARRILEQARVVYLSPQGRRLDQQGVMDLAGSRDLIMVAGRYEGIDERVIALQVDDEWSIGDYVVSGGELPAMVVIDAMVRTLPGVLGHGDSAKEESFFDGLLDYPHYTRPEQIDSMQVPGVLLGGNHDQIRCWRLKQALGRTWERRPDLLETLQLDEEQRTLLDEYIREQDPTGK